MAGLKFSLPRWRRPVSGPELPERSHPFHKALSGGEIAFYPVGRQRHRGGATAAATSQVSPQVEHARPVNPTVMSRAEWQQKRVRRDSFAARVAVQPKLFVIGSEDDLG
jgi:hypothetical protein